MSKNAATSFEQLANKAVASDAGLRTRYGELEPVNSGEEVICIDMRTGKDYVGYDSLFLWTASFSTCPAGRPRP